MNYALTRHHILWRTGKLDSAEEKYKVLANLRAAQAIRPDHPRIAQDLTLLLRLQIKDVNAALLEAERWAQLEPKNDLAQRTLARLRKPTKPDSGTPPWPRCREQLRMRD